MIKKSVQLLAGVCAAVGLAVAVPTASADPPTLVGGLYLQGYCQSLGYSGATLLKGTPYGPNYAYNNWRCASSDGSTHPFSMEQACQSQWGVNAILAIPGNPNSAYSWNCYAPGNHTG